MAKSNEKMDAKRLAQVYDLVTDFQERNHARNQRRIKIGLRCLYMIPAVFLFLLMVTKSSKIIFLALWIISLFVLAVYLIAVEYMDDQLQRQIALIKGEEDSQVESLVEPEGEREKEKKRKKQAEHRKREGKNE